MGQITLRQWLHQEITAVLNQHGSAAPFIVWCDPERVWRDLLRWRRKMAHFELWADETHELILRERFYQTPRTPRVIWLPVSRENIGYFEIFALQAEEVREEGLPQALSRYGVNIPTARWHELAPLLPAYAKTWIDYPLEYWRKTLSRAIDRRRTISANPGRSRPAAHGFSRSAASASLLQAGGGGFWPTRSTSRDS